MKKKGPTQRRKHNMRELVPMAKAFVIRTQQVSYNLLCAELGTDNVTVVQDVLKRLKAQKVIAQMKNRRWTVLVKPDGSTVPPPAEGPKPKKISRSRKDASKSKPAPASVAKAPTSSAPAAVGNGTFTHAQELKKLEQILGASSGETRAILASIVVKYRKVGDALRVAQVLS